MSTKRLVGLSAVGLVLLSALVLLTMTPAQRTQAVLPAFGDGRYFFTGVDPCPDVITAPDGSPWVYQGVCGGVGEEWTFTGPTQITTEDLYDQILMPGNWNTDLCSDLIGVKNGKLFLLQGNCAGGITATLEMPGDFSQFDYFVAPGPFTEDAFPDLIARRHSDGALVLFMGDGATGLVDFGIIGRGFGIADIILGAGDFVGNDGCPDLMARRTDDDTVHVYGNSCEDDIGLDSDTVVTGGEVLADFDWIIGGGDWRPEDLQKCPDLLAWKRSDPANIKIFGGVCVTTSINTTDIGNVVNPLPWTFPFGGDSGKVFTWGDVDCNGSIGPVDSLKLLRVDAGETVQQPTLCHNFGDVIFVDTLAILWGDVDCVNVVNPVDSLKVLRIDAGEVVTQTEEDCPQFKAGFPIGILG